MFISCVLLNNVRYLHTSTPITQQYLLWIELFIKPCCFFLPLCNKFFTVTLLYILILFYFWSLCLRTSLLVLILLAICISLFHLRLVACSLCPHKKSCSCTWIFKCNKTCNQSPGSGKKPKPSQIIGIFKVISKSHLAQSPILTKIILLSVRSHLNKKQH